MINAQTGESVGKVKLERRIVQSSYRSGILRFVFRQEKKEFHKLRPDCRAIADLHAFGVSNFSSERQGLSEAE
ncbi:MAG TPA: hypothetical protein PKN13_13585 [Accumulibacter sp.]|nr:hypothetical protein [Accumulibacter sp.]HNG38972.1 hypothetical protein [Accumulibacter sp.]HNI74175.1 hypothetical protein [Accumulibacter sp.]HNM76344.1 hypothetical protein [Accumulibacter sp.]HNO58587.1 hypothetical protein [Accumulibacter sp.]